MSLTIQDCASKITEERRERRRKRILQNAEERLSTILSGPDGTEKRQAPTIEGIFGSDEKISSSICRSEINNNEQKTGKQLQQIAQDQTTKDDDAIHFVAPVYCELVDKHRFWLMIVLGMALRIAVAFNWIQYVLAAFTAIFLSWEFLVAIPQKRLLSKYPKHGYLVNTLLIAGLNERIVVWIGLGLDLLWEFGMDLYLVVFACCCSHLFFTLAHACFSTHLPSIDA